MSKLSNFFIEKGLPALARAVLGNPIGALTSLFEMTGEKTEESIIKNLQGNSKVLEALKDKEIEYANLILKDRASARRMQVDINRSNKSSWITKNVTAVIALGWITFCMYLYWLSLVGNVGKDQQMNVTIVSSITNITMLIVGFYFGSSEKKDKNTL